MEKPTVSIIIPCRNEENYISGAIKNVLDQTYDQSLLEVLIIDGKSSDKTVKIINDFSENHKNIKLLINEKKTVPYAMNKGIGQASGDIIIRMDAHAAYPPDYVAKLVEWKFKLNADNVGGIWETKPASESSKAFAIAYALSHPFGVGNSDFRIGADQPKEADTVPFGCYHRLKLLEIGGYDERLKRNQDIELNKRLKRKGGRIFLVPDIHCTYYARDTFKKLWKNNFENGRWVILTAYYTGELSSLSLRHFIPLCFFLYLIVLPFLFLLHIIFMLPIILYTTMILYFSLKISLQKYNIGLFPYLITSFLILHLSYGTGSMKGIFDLLKRSRD